MATIKIPTDLNKFNGQSIGNNPGNLSTINPNENIFDTAFSPITNAVGNVVDTVGGMIRQPSVYSRDLQDPYYSAGNGGTKTVTSVIPPYKPTNTGAAVSGSPVDTPVSSPTTQTVMNVPLGSTQSSGGVFTDQQGNVYTPNGFGKGYTVAIKNVNTVGGIYGNLVAKLSPEDQAIADAEAAKLGLSTSVANESDQSIQDRITKQFQQEIDSLNSTYADKLRNSQLAGANRLGQETALLGGAGMLGQVSGAGEMNNVNDANAQADQAVVNEKNAALSAVYSNIRKGVSDAVVAKTKAASEGADSLISNLKNAKANKKSLLDQTVKNLVASNPKIKYTDQDFTALATNEDGSQWIDPSVLKTSYDEQKSVADAAAKDRENSLAKIKSELETEASTRLKNGADLTKPYSAGGRIYQYDPFKSVYKDIGADTSKDTSTLSATEVTQAANKLIATAEFKAMDKKTQADAIRMIGATPSDFGY